MTTTNHESRTTNPPALAVRDVQFTYPARRRQPARAALRGVNLSVPAGQFVAMLGPNGSGKSTLMKIICGLLPAPSGSVAIFGSNSPREMRAALGVVFQSPGLDRHMTVRENLRDQAALYPLTFQLSIDDELARAGLGDRAGHVVKTLSQGLARRVDLVRALLHQPRLLLLDEPTAGLDPSAREQFLALLDARRQAGDLTILMSTHLIDEAERADRVIMLHEGAVVADDAPVNLRRTLGGPGARRVTVHDPAWVPPDSDVWQRAQDGWRLEIGDDSARLTALLADLAPAGVPYSVAPPTLGDVFERLTGASLTDEIRPQPHRGERT